MSCLSLRIVLILFSHRFCRSFSLVFVLPLFIFIMFLSLLRSPNVFAIDMAVIYVIFLRSSLDRIMFKYCLCSYYIIVLCF